MTPEEILKKMIERGIIGTATPGQPTHIIISAAQLEVARKLAGMPATEAKEIFEENGGGNDTREEGQG